MSVAIKYTGTEAEKDQKALDDILDYLGQEKVDLLVQLAQDPETTEHQLRGWIGFAGIHGYPVDAFVRKHRPKKDD